VNFVFRNKHSRFVLAGFVLIGIVIGVVLTTSFNLDSRTHALPPSSKIYQESAQAEQNAEAPVLNAANFNPNMMFVDIVKNVRPSIVSIYTTKNIKVRTDPFFYFFRERRMMPDDENHNQDMKQSGLGSGVIISRDGYIITNHHVIEDVDELRVKLIDNREFPAKVIGSDPTTEIALVKIDATDLPIAVLGNSENLQIGEWVMAIGSPLDLASTVTAGIVSALSRKINIIGRGGNPSSIEDFIQTDAAINPGNSGGALVNLKGEVIGINTAIATQTNYYMGYGFAVPINIAKSVIDDLLEYGEVRRGYLGVYIAEVNSVTAKGVKLDKPRGVFITSVIKDGAADKAGIEEGDVILKVNGVDVNQPNEMQAKVGAHNPGDKISLEIWRDGKSINLKATLEGQNNKSGAVSSSKKEQDESIPELGMKVRDLNANEKANLDIEGGAFVQSVDPYGIAAKAQISPNDVVVEVDSHKIKNTDDFYDRIKHLDDNVVKLKLRRMQGSEIFDRLVFLEITQ
jgi:serine protease Do